MAEITLEQFLDRVSPEPNTGCWLWDAALTSKGYGTIRTGGRMFSAHVVSFRLHGHVVPEGLMLDHLCRVRCCVNPDHLEAVTCRINILRGVGPSAMNARKTHCIRGHLLGGENVYPTQENERECYACKRLRSSEFVIRRRQKHQEAKLESNCSRE